MTIYPAIDLRGGNVVRLRQGRTDEQTIYSRDPVGVALRWETEGAQWLHIVDLDGALDEASTSNALALSRIRLAVRTPIQFGGGLRDLPALKRAFDVGVDRIVIGTMAVEHPELFSQVFREYDCERVVLALDSIDGRVATRGWRHASRANQVSFGQRIREMGVRRAIVTDISRDGMLTGIDAEKLTSVARETGLSVIASGGIAGLDDLKTLRRLENEGIEGAVVGQALYAGRITLRDAIQVTSAR